jgi:HPt (histidine-containing phosphotransfer) domain-containing protein
LIPKTAQKIFNRQALDQLKVLNQPGQSDIVAELVSDFLGHLPTRVAELQKAIASGMMSEVVRVSHALKSAAAVLGLEELETACRDIEMNPSSGASSLGPLGDRLTAAQNALNKYLQP